MDVFAGVFSEIVDVIDLTDNRREIGGSDVLLNREMRHKGDS